MRPNLVCLIRIVEMWAGVSALCVVAFAGGLSPPRSGDMTRSTLDSLRALLANRRLELSTSDTSDSKEFCFEFISVFSPRIGAPSSRILVLRDRDCVAMLVRDLKGNCYAYFTDGLMIAIDHHRPGGFVVMKSGFPQGTFGLDPKSGVGFEWSYYRSAPGHRIMVSFGDVLQYLLRVVSAASYDPHTDSYTLETPRTVSTLALTPPNERGTFLVRDFINKRPDFTMEFSFIDSTAIPAVYAGLVGNTNTITGELYKCGAAIRDLTHKKDDTVVDNAVTEALKVPGDLGRAPEERKAISTLTNVLKLEDDAATRKSTWNSGQ